MTPKERLQAAAENFARLRHDYASIASSYQDAHSGLNDLITYRFHNFMEFGPKYLAIAEKYANRYHTTYLKFIQAQDDLREATKAYLQNPE